MPPYLCLRSQKKGMMHSAQPMAPSADVNHGFSNVCTCGRGTSVLMCNQGLYCHQAEVHFAAGTAWHTEMLTIDQLMQAGRQDFESNTWSRCGHCSSIKTLKLPRKVAGTHLAV